MLFAGDDSFAKLRTFIAQSEFGSLDRCCAWLAAVRVRRAALAAVLPFMGVVAAFGIAPDTMTEKVVAAAGGKLAPMRASSAHDDTYWARSAHPAQRHDRDLALAPSR